MNRRNFIKRGAAAAAVILAAEQVAFPLHAEEQRSEHLVSPSNSEEWDDTTRTLPEYFDIDFERQTLTWLPGVPQRLTIGVYSAAMDYFDELAQMDDPVPFRWGERVMDHDLGDEYVVTCCQVVNDWQVL